MSTFSRNVGFCRGLISFAGVCEQMFQEDKYDYVCFETVMILTGCRHGNRASSACLSFLLALPLTSKCKLAAVNTLMGGVGGVSLPEGY